MGIAKSRQTYFQSHSANPSKVVFSDHTPTDLLVCRNSAIHWLTSQVQRKGKNKCSYRAHCIYGFSSWPLRTLNDLGNLGVGFVHISEIVQNILFKYESFNNKAIY